MDEFDFIVIGGGSAGSVVAGRLADSGATVCVLESGPMDRNIWIHIPGGMLKLQNEPSVVWHLEAEGPRGTNRRVPVRQGHVIGGGGSINGMMINRGWANDFNYWAQLGNRGWSYADVLPYFKRMEKREGKGDERLRGRDGPLPVTNGGLEHPLCDAFMDAAVNAGLPRDEDYNGPNADGVCRMQFNMRRGRRVSSARAFLHPAMRRNVGLDVRTNAHVVRILVEGSRAVGARYVHERGGKEIEIRARREVILCAGALQSPKLLQLSGIGAPPLLQDLGINVMHPLEGVGDNLQDHYNVRPITRIKNALTINDIARGPRLVGEMLKCVLGRSNVITSNPVPIVATLRSDPGRDTTDITAFFTPSGVNYATRELTPFSSATWIVWQMRPASRGQLRAHSPDPFVMPFVDPNYLGEDEDRRSLVGGLKELRRIQATEPFSHYNDGEEAPGSQCSTDQALLEWAQQTGNTCFHFVGTCKMGPKTDSRAVVDAELRVHGLAGLRVADASVMPNLPSGNTNAPTMMVADRAADFILGRAPLSPIHLPEQVYGSRVVSR